MGQLVSCSNKPPLHIHEAGFLYNIKLNNSSIKELKTLKRIIRTNIQDQNQFNIDDSILTKEIKNRETVLATTREKLFLQQQESTPRYCVTIIASFLLHSALLMFSFVIVHCAVHQLHLVLRELRAIWKDSVIGLPEKVLELSYVATLCV